MANRLPNMWVPGDPRFEGLLKISRAISDAFDLAAGQSDIAERIETDPGIYLFWIPLKLARFMREAADRIESMTDGSL